MLANRRKKRTRRRLLFWLFTFLILSVSASGWWLWQQKKSQRPRLNFLLISVNGEPRKLLAGETLSLRPKDQLKITDISTTIPFNMDIRLVCKGLDVNALQYDAITLSELLPQKDSFQRYQFPIEVKYLNHDIGHITWIIQPYAEDWLEKANRIIDDQMRLTILERGNRLLPGDGRIHDRLLSEYMAQEKWKNAVPMLCKKTANKNDMETLKDLMICYGALKDQDGIVRVLGEILKKHPDDLETRVRLAKILEGRGEWGEAAEQYEIMIEHAPPDERLPLYKNLGYLYTKVGKSEKAVSAYLSAANLDQKDPNLHYNLSALYAQLGRQKEADFYLNNAVTLNSDDFEVGENQVFTQDNILGINRHALFHNVNDGFIVLSGCQNFKQFMKQWNCLARFLPQELFKLPGPQRHLAGLQICHCQVFIHQYPVGIFLRTHLKHEDQLIIFTPIFQIFENKIVSVRFIWLKIQQHQRLFVGGSGIILLSVDIKKDFLDCDILRVILDIPLKIGQRGFQVPSFIFQGTQIISHSLIFRVEFKNFPVDFPEISIVPLLLQNIGHEGHTLL